MGLCYIRIILFFFIVERDSWLAYWQVVILPSKYFLPCLNPKLEFVRIKSYSFVLKKIKKISTASSGIFSLQVMGSWKPGCKIDLIWGNFFCRVYKRLLVSKKDESMLEEKNLLGRSRLDNTVIEYRNGVDHWWFQENYLVDVLWHASDTWPCGIFRCIGCSFWSFLN